VRTSVGAKGVSASMRGVLGKKKKKRTSDRQPVKKIKGRGRINTKEPPNVQIQKRIRGQLEGGGGERKRGATSHGSNQLQINAEGEEEVSSQMEGVRISKTSGTGKRTSTETNLMLQQRMGGAEKRAKQTKTEKGTGKKRCVEREKRPSNVGVG